MIVCADEIVLKFDYFFVIKIIRVVFRFVCIFVFIKILFFTSCFRLASMTIFLIWGVANQLPAPCYVN